MALRKFSTDGRNIPFTVFQIEHLYHDEGLTLREIADRFGVTHQAVHDRLRRAGVQLRRRATRAQPTPVDEKTLRRLYESEKLSAREIAERLGTTLDRVRRWLKRYNIEGRPPRLRPRRLTLGGLELGESLVLKRPNYPTYHRNFYRMAKRAGIRVKVRTIDEQTARVTRIA